MRCRGSGGRARSGRNARRPGRVLLPAGQRDPAQRHTGVNRSCFSSLTPPFVGGTWTARIRCERTRGERRSAATSRCSGPREGPVTTFAGELLIRVGSLHLARKFVPSSGRVRRLRAADPARSPRSWASRSTRRRSCSDGASELCNALDLKLGN
jgi:hypothetical protein